MTRADAPIASDRLGERRRFSVAPMMDWTDRDFRYLMRLLSREAVLYSEMLTPAAVLHGDRARLLGKDPLESPVVLQLGGSERGDLAAAAAIGAEWGYDAINLNCGCPSARVQSGRFGARLMAEPERVGDLVAGMREAVDVPVSVKCRLGIDRQDEFDTLLRFVETVASRSGCREFIVHARKAWLDGLDPKQNRTLPPLRHEYVWRLKQAFPQMHVTVNGGLTDWEAIEHQLEHVDGVMVGRAACHNPAFIADVDQRCFALVPDDTSDGLERLANVARDYARYMESRREAGVRVSTPARYLVNLFRDCPGARRWRRRLSEGAVGCKDPIALVDDALALLGEPS